MKRAFTARGPNGGLKDSRDEGVAAFSAMGIGRFDGDTLHGLVLGKTRAAFAAAITLDDPVFVLESAKLAGFSIAASTVHLLSTFCRTELK